MFMITIHEFLSRIVRETVTILIPEFLSYLIL